MILVDAGPLVAVFAAQDADHARCVQALRELREEAGTVWPVIAEAMHLLRGAWEAQDELWRALEESRLLVLQLDETDMPRMHELMRKYRDLPMDLADAALVRVAERQKIRRVFTLDRRDFTVYRPAGLGRFDIVP